MSFLDPLGLLQEGAPNLSLLAIVGALGLAAWPHWYTIYLAERNKVNGGWTNVQPRIYVGQLANKASAGGKLTKLESTILRGQSAQANGFENVPLFGLTMLIGTYAKLPSHTLNRTTALYLVGRIIYNWLYLTTETKKNSYWRTLVFNTSMFALIRIIVLSTLRINGLY